MSAVAINPSQIPSESVIIFDPKSPPTPENDCVGKYWNENDIGCAGDPNNADLRYRQRCMCFEECAVKTKQRAEGVKEAKKKPVKDVKKEAAQPTAPAPIPTTLPTPIASAAPALPVATAPVAPTVITPTPVPKTEEINPTAQTGSVEPEDGKFDPKEFTELQIPGLTPEYNDQYKAVYFKNAAGDYQVKVFPTPRKKRYVLYSLKEFVGFEKRNGKYFTGPMSKLSSVLEHLKLFAA